MSARRLKVNKAGGKRVGAGRKEGATTKEKKESHSIRLYPTDVGELNTSVQEWVDYCMHKVKTESDIPPDYKVTLDLDHNVRLRQLLFSHDQYRWFYEHTYRKMEGRKCLFVNKFRLMIEYNKGILSNIEISMDMTNVGNRGKVFAWGLDVSPRSTLYLEFMYRKSGENWKLCKIQKSCQPIWEESEESGLFPIRIDSELDMPFPFRDELLTEGGLRIPYLNDDGEERDIYVSTDINS